MAQIDFHEFTLTTGIENQINGVKSGYYLYPDGRVRIYVNVNGLTANTNTTIATIPESIRPKAPHVTCRIGNDGVEFGWNKGYFLQLTDNGNVTCRSTSQYCLGLAIDYYPATE